MVAPKRTWVSSSSLDAKRLATRGCRSLVNVAFGPTNTSSASVTPSHTCTPFLITQRSPITVSCADVQCTMVPSCTDVWLPTITAP